MAHLTYKNQCLNSYTKIGLLVYLGHPIVRLSVSVCVLEEGKEQRGGKEAASTIVLKDVGCW